MVRGPLACVVVACVAFAAEAQSPPGVSREGPALVLQVDGSRPVRIIDSTTGDQRRHELVAWWPDHRLYVVDVVMHEARQAYLVSARDGHITTVAAPPVLSPSGRYAIAWEPSPLIGNPMELVDLRGDRPIVRKVEGKPACPGIGRQDGIRPDPVWIDGDRVAFEGKSLFSGDDPNARQVLRIADGMPSWEC
ncbi:MAG: hypothetical protein EPO67_14640 [Reyranella sp.]|nr:MAG: hypothetical protein EPO67_14640 [Reyranella sp.]